MVEDPDDIARIDDCCDRFERAFRNGDQPTVADYLNHVDAPLREELLRELLCLEAELLADDQWQQRVATYLLELSEYADIILEISEETRAQRPPQLSDKATTQPSNEPATLTVDTVPASPLQMVGNYKLLQRIGEGGMGSVYMAEQQEPVKRRVALKLIRSGIDSRQVVARFEAERQALALMDHPNIARILEAGATANGQPYFAMELVKGVPLTDHCDRNRLNLYERIGLLIDVCSAVQHAHQKGIIHRDLKPSNILVAQHDGRATPKVIDFGLAKALESSQKLTDKTMFTEFGQVLGTVKYMSPEQASLDDVDIDTRTDVYALGVILYELLTGSTPLDQDTIRGHALLKILELVREKDPPRPSVRLSSRKDALASITEQRRTDIRTLEHVLRGDLDWIAVKALEKDRNRRYESAAGLGDDLRRFLDDDPVLARPPSTSYRLRKFVRKHRALVLGATTIATLLFAAVLISTWFGVAANIARRDAVAEKNKADDAADKERLARADAEEQTRQARFQAAGSMMQRAFTARDHEHNPAKATLLFLEAGMLFRSINEADRAGSAFIASAACRNVSQLPNDGEIVGARFSKSGLRAMTWGGSATKGIVQLWDTGDPRCLQTLTNDSFVWKAQFLNNESRVLCGCADGSVSLWDLSQSKRLRSFEHDDRLSGFQLIDDASRLLTWSEDKTARLWDVESGDQLQILGHDGEVLGADVAKDGSMILTWSSNDQVRIWEDGSDTPVRTYRHEGLEGARLQGTKPLAVTWGSGTVKVWSEDETAARHTLAMGRSWVHVEPLNESLILALGPDRMRMWDIERDQVGDFFPCATPFETAKVGYTQGMPSHVLTRHEDSTIRIWDLVARRPLVTYTDGLALSDFASESGGAGISGTKAVSWNFDGSMRLWRSYIPQPRSSFLEDEVLIYATANEGRTRFITWGRGPGPRSASQLTPTWQNSPLRLWNFGQRGIELVGAQESEKYKLDESVLSHDGSRLVTNQPPSLWNVANGQRVGSFQNEIVGNLYQINGCAISDDNSLVITCGLGVAALWKIDREAPVRFFRHAPSVTLPGSPGPVKGARFFADDSRVLTWCDDGTARIWDVEQDNAIHVLRHSHKVGVADARLSGDETKILTYGGSDDVVKLWDANDGSFLHEYDSDSRIFRAAFSADGTKVLTWGDGGAVRVWTTSDSIAIAMLQDPSNGLIKPARFVADDSKVLALCEGKVRLWSIDDEAIVRTFHVPEAYTTRFQVNHDESLLLTLGYDGSRLWEMDTGKLLRTFRAFFLNACFYDDGDRILSWDSPDVKLWDAAFKSPLQLLASDANIRAKYFAPHRRVLTWGRSGRSFSQLDGHRDTPDDILRLEAEVQVGATIDRNSQELRSLTAAEWTEKRKRLKRLGAVRDDSE